MQLHEREFFINRIASGYIRCNVDNKVYKLFSPNIDILYEASEIYSNTYIKAVEEELLDDDDIFDYLITSGKWSIEDEEKLLNKLPKYSEEFKLEMLDNINDKSKLDTIRKYLRKTEGEIKRLFDIRHSIDYLGCHGAASFAKIYFIIERCVDKKKINVNKILSVVNNSMISEQSIRELSRTDPWRQMWAARKFDSLFGKSVSEYSDEQKRLVNWSMLYDSVFESHECPSETIVNDDDLFDAFLITRRRRLESDQVKNEYEERIARHNNASEVFLPINKDEIKKASLLNDPTAKAIIENRIKTIEKLGSASDKDFSDIKTQIAMMKNRK